MFALRLPLCFVGLVSRVELYAYMHAHIVHFLICDRNAPKRGKVIANLLTILLIKLPSSYFLINGEKTKLLSLFQEKKHQFQRIKTDGT
jgi:hypothetical protein